MQRTSIVFFLVSIALQSLAVGQDKPPQSHTATQSRTQQIRLTATDTWPSFRGSGGRGLAANQKLPDSWNVADNEAVGWKVPIPGLANSCPIVWKDKVFLTTAVSSAGNHSLRIGLYGAGAAAGDQSEHTWSLFCLELKTGRTLWQKVADKRVPNVKRHTKSTQANSTPATNGRYVVALFNFGGLYCYDMCGKRIWKKDLGLLDSGAFDLPDYQWGFGSSPIIVDDLVIVQCDIQKGSFIAAFKIENGEQVWRIPRKELPSWGTPTAYRQGSKTLVVANGTNFVRGYNARDGQEVWRLSRNSKITVPTPFVADGLMFITSGYRPIQPIYAVRLDAEGDISLKQGADTNKHIAWSKERGGTYLPTPIGIGKYLYTCSMSGILTCYEIDTGNQVYRRRVTSGSAASFTASPVAADGRLYLTSESGVVFAIKAGPKFELLSENPTGEYCLATPAIAGGFFLLRTQHHLVAIGK